MAELATIARPYAEALYEVARQQDLNQWAAQVDELAAVSANPQLRQFADNPKVTSAQVFDLIVSVVKTPLADGVKNFLRTVIENGRLAALPAIAEQFHALKNEASGVSDALIVSAYPIEPAQLADLVATLEKRFGRKLQAKVEVDPELIGGVRVVVGDEVLDTSVKARLERMKVALTA
ncbi:MAG TPA: F0F1 ATP synthase subunit delta [Burkholderiaceae bacterium]|nr:F0F1 ATP synthase subunit delta [Burkholderiaceae bacterium]